MQTPLLSRSLLGSGPVLAPDLQCGPLEEFPERIIQFGEGNFLRGFVDWMVDVMNEKGLFGGRAVVVQPIQVGIAKALNDQDGLYTLILRGMSGGEVVEQRRVITSVSRGLNPYDDWAQVVACAVDPGIRFLFSNTTEAGITYSREVFDAALCPATFPAKITSLLWHRYKALGGDAAPGLVFLPCELIDRNGDKLREAVMKHADDWQLGEAFTAWAGRSNHFLNTLVDRIVPGYPAEEADRLREELGYADMLMDTGEFFHLWVIEGPKELADEIPFHKAGLNVVWTDDMTPYRTRKVRILNGAHTSSVLAAFLAGTDTVLDMMNDTVFSAMLRRAVFDEIMPTFPLDEEEKRRYAEDVLERFRNPFVRHELLSISLNSVSKWKVRVLPSILDHQRMSGGLPPVLVFSLAALILFYRGVGTSDRELRGTRDRKPYPIRDDLDVLSFFEKRWHAFSKNHDLRALVSIVLANESLWGTDLTLLPGMLDAVAANLQGMLVDGTRATAAALLGIPDPS